MVLRGGGAFKRILSHEGRALIDGISTLKIWLEVEEGALALLPSAFSYVRKQEEGPQHGPKHGTMFNKNSLLMHNE